MVDVPLADAGHGRKRHLTAMAASPRVLIGGVILVALALCAVFAPWLAPHDPIEQDLLYFFLPPFWDAQADPAFLLGSDSLGRDILSRLIYGTRIALVVAVVAACLACVVGTLLGLVAGYFGGKVDMAISRLVDVWMAFPPVLLSVVLVAVIGAGLEAVIIAIVVVDWTRFCRVVRAEVMVQRAQDYVTAARIVGLGRWQTIVGEILPNVAPLLIVLLTLEMGIAVVVETILSFVGLSVAGDTATWGGMIAEGRTSVHQAWWLMALPIACVVVTVIALNMLGDGLRKTLDPVLRK